MFFSASNVLAHINIMYYCIYMLAYNTTYLSTLPVLPLYTVHNMLHNIKTHDSESQGQEEAGRTRRTSELFTRSTALKFVNTLNKLP